MAWTKTGNVKGPQGLQGTVGPQGNPGTAATIAAGNTATLTPGAPATVTQRGTAQAAIFDFGIPQGTQGVAGPTGPASTVPGPQGPQGIQGVKGDVGAQGPAGPIPPLADATQDGLLRKVSGLTTDFVDGSNHCKDLATVVQPVIWSARLRSYNALGNPTFDVDQINGSVIGAQTSGKTIDRWFVNKVGTMAISAGRANSTAGDEVLVPGTNFRISLGYHRIQLTTAQTTLAAGDNIYMYQRVEGSRFRELSMDVHSTGILVRSSVANLKFCISFRDAPATKSLVKLCTLGAANTWTLIQLPNLPIWAAGGNWSSVPGVVGLIYNICLASGSTFLASAADVWQNGDFLGVAGMDNFASKAVNSTFDIAFCQHESGPLCSTPIDLPFNENLDQCLRYFTKSYHYTSVPGVVTAPGNISFYEFGSSHPYIPVQFKKIMAKAPTIAAYSPATGAINNVRNNTGAADIATSGSANVADSGFQGFLCSSLPTTTWVCAFHYTADTGW
jgi:hypothetical protein